MAFRYAGFTVMMPEFRPEEAVSLLKELGYDGVEWRVDAIAGLFAEKADPTHAGKPSMDMESVVKNAEWIRALCEDNELEIVGLGTYLSYKFLDDVKKCMEAAKLMDAPSIRVSTPKYTGLVNYNDLYEEAVDGYAKVESLAKQYGVRATIEVHPSNICSSASLAYRFVSNFDPDYVGVVYDPANMVCEGYESWQLGLELLGPYLSHVHVKNTAWVADDDHATQEKRWRNVATPMKEGLVPWWLVMSVLDKIGYKGWLSLEDFSPGDTKTKLAEGISYMKSIERDRLRK
ncbi:MAG: sugar phosphate isomerase/epimerase family protein [Armatimonadota bacterium]|nr:sugar phosphate isomerase/epimerase [bacterium]